MEMQADVILKEPPPLRKDTRRGAGVTGPSPSYAPGSDFKTTYSDYQKTSE